MATEDECDDIAMVMLEKLCLAINDTKRFTQEQSASMWGFISDEARTWEALITREMEEANDEG